MGYVIPLGGYFCFITAIYLAILKCKNMLNKSYLWSKEMVLILTSKYMDKEYASVILGLCYCETRVQRERDIP